MKLIERFNNYLKYLFDKNGGVKAEEIYKEKPNNPYVCRYAKVIEVKDGWIKYRTSQIFDARSNAIYFPSSDIFISTDKIKGNGRFLDAYEKVKENINEK